MASLILPAETSSDDEQVEEQSQETHLSIDATQTMFDSPDDDIYDVGSSVANRRSIELECDLNEEHENESEHDKNTNTVTSTGQVPMSQSEESEANQSTLKKPKKRCRKYIRLESETEKSTDKEDVIDETQGSSRTSKLSTIKKEEAEMKKTIAVLGKTVKENKAKGKPPAKQYKSNRPKSIVWSEGGFDYPIIDGKKDLKKAQCGQCRAILKKCSGTTNLRLHLMSKHKEFWKKLNAEKPDQPKLSAYLDQTKQWPRGSSNALKYDKYLAKFVIKNHLSLSIVKCDWLKKLCVPNYKLPGRTYFTDTILKNMYEETLGKVKDIFKDLKNIGVQVDHYTSSQHLPYANVCVSYLDSDFQMQNVSLGTFGYEDGHHSDEIYSSMEGEHGIVQKMFSGNPNRIYTTDTTNSMSSAFENKPNIAWFGCFAHILHLLVKQGLMVTEVAQLLTQLHAITSYFHKSPKSNILLKDNATWLGFPDLSVKTKSGCPTRWN